VLACHILNQREKLNWKNCTLEREKEEELARVFRKDIDKRSQKNRESEGK
jgi:hypothetical protein